MASASLSGWCPGSWLGLGLRSAAHYENVIEDMVVVGVETDTFLILIPNIPSLSLRRTKRPVVIENCGEIGEWLRSYFG